MPVNSQVVRVGTFNIAHGKPGDGFDRACQQLAALNLDILFLQEADKHTFLAPFADQVAAIARACAMQTAVFAPAESSWLTVLPVLSPRRRTLGGWGSGVGVVSRFPMIESRLIPLDSVQPLLHRRRKWFSMDQPRQLAEVRLALPDGGELVAASMHLSFRKQSGLGQAEQAGAAVGRGLNMVPVLVGADLNSTSNITAWPTLANAPTFPAAEPTRAIDWILGDGEPVGEPEVVRLAISDHRSLVAQVRVGA